MMYHLRGEDGSYPSALGASAAAAPAAAAVSGAASAGALSSDCSCSSGSPSDPLMFTLFSSSIYALLLEEIEHTVDAREQDAVNYPEICREREHGEDHDRGGAFDLFAVGPRHPFHFES